MEPTRPAAKADTDRAGSPRSQAQGPAGPIPSTRGLLGLQRSAGNQAVGALVKRRSAVQRRSNDEVIQRHWLPEEEQIQALHDRSSSAPSVRGRAPGWGRARGFGAPAPLGRQSDPSAALWGRRPTLQRDPPDVKGPDVKGPDVKGPDVKAPVLGPVGLSLAELPADGKTTSTAVVKSTPPGAAVKWSVTGPASGTTISDAGVITAGNDTQTLDGVDVTIKAEPKDGGGTSSEAKLKLWDVKFLQAKKDFEKFLSGSFAVPNFTAGLNGKFDMQYTPSTRQAQVTVKVRFEFPDDPIPKPSVWNLFGLTNQTETAAAKARQLAYAKNFLNTVTTQWSGRYQFENVRQPQSVWGKLNPVSVKTNVVEVPSGEHFKITVKNKSAGTASVGGGELKLFQGNEVPVPAFNPTTAAGELARVNRNTPTPILFGNGDATVPADDAAKLAFLGTYIRRISNPKFQMAITGHASKTGKTAENQTLSEARAANVSAALGGPGNHAVTATGVGEAGATAGPEWRKVDITSAIPAGWQNMQDVTAHEFGHMLGLGDEYAGGASPTATHYNLVKQAFGQAYADQVAKRGDTDYASIMEGGNDVRIQHYVTIWDALVQAAAKATVPDPKFGQQDWKFIG